MSPVTSAKSSAGKEKAARTPKGASKKSAASADSISESDNVEVSNKPRKDSGELSAMLLPELKKVASQLGIDGAAKMSKGDLVDSIAGL